MAYHNPYSDPPPFDHPRPCGHGRRLNNALSEVIADQRAAYEPMAHFKANGRPAHRPEYQQLNLEAALKAHAQGCYECRRVGWHL